MKIVNVSGDGEKTLWWRWLLVGVQVISIGGDGKILVWKVDQKKGKLKLLDGWVQDEQCSLWSDWGVVFILFAVSLGVFGEEKYTSWLEFNFNQTKDIDKVIMFLCPDSKTVDYFF